MGGNGLTRGLNADDISTAVRFVEFLKYGISHVCLNFKSQITLQ